MKALYFLLCCLSPLLFFGQDLRNKVDSGVLAINNDPAKTVSFSKTEESPDNKQVTYKYRFKLIKGHPGYVEREFSNGDSLVSQIFYTRDNFLIFSSESITYYYGRDSIGWGGSYYFANGKLKDYETLGHGKSEDETWNPEVEVLRNYRMAKSDVLAYLKKKKGN
jgi:hypothetical protein